MNNLPTYPSEAIIDNSTRTLSDAYVSVVLFGNESQYALKAPNNAVQRQQLLNTLLFLVQQLQVQGANHN